MLELLFLAAAAQVQTIRLPPVPPASPTLPSPVVIEPRSPAEVGVTLLPDLVVKQVRVENDAKLQVLVANQGHADAMGDIDVQGDGLIGTLVGHSATMTVRDLKAGEERWVAILGWETTDPYRPATGGFPLGKVTRLTFEIDRPHAKSQFPVLVHISGVSGGKRDCNLERGCVRESDEANNKLSVEGDAIQRGTPERLNAPELAPVTLPERG